MGQLGLRGVVMAIVTAALGSFVLASSPPLTRVGKGSRGRTATNKNKLNKWKMMAHNNLSEFMWRFKSDGVCVTLRLPTLKRKNNNKSVNIYTQIR